MDHDATHFTFEPEHDKTNKMTRARSEDRTVWESAQSDQSHCAAIWVANDLNFRQSDSEVSGQTGRMPRLI